MLDLLKGYRIFSSLDATDGFWQTLMEMRSRKFTGFVVDGKHYHWVVMPMGLTNARGIWIRYWET
uniref:Reverse transcriptase domain-containing protein n=1 Tax=Arcella intermedia TaxID=1963864 RepID=A0A6B2LX37_9EUKA